MACGRAGSPASRATAPQGPEGEHLFALFERIVSDREGAALAARLGEARVVDEPDEHLLADRLLEEVERTGASLAVVGCRGYSRPVGIARGAPTTTVVHEAPCSVLVTRGVTEPEAWPRRIVAGVNGSPEATRAAEVARRIADRLGARLDVVTARGADPVTVLAEASEDADLVVVGSRGLGGVRALASVSERVAHEARCPVLVVRSTSGSASPSHDDVDRVGLERRPRGLRESAVSRKQSHPSA